MRNSIYLFLACLIVCSCNNNTAINQEKLEQLERAQQEAQAYQQQMESPTIMHTVYIWLKEDLSEADEQAFVQSCKSLSTIESVKRLRMGKPSNTENREVVDQSYSYGMNIEFVDLAAHDAYQVDPIHLKFIEDHKDKWTKVVVYDNEM